MKTKVNSKLFWVVCDALIASGAKSATKFVDEHTIIRATWHMKPSGRNSRESMVVTFGTPNYREALFIKACKKAGEPFPCKKVQLRLWPKKRKPK